MGSSGKDSNVTTLIKDLLSANPSLLEDDIRFTEESMSLDLSFSRVTDIQPLTKYPLQSIDITGTRVKEFPKFIHASLESADIEGTDIVSLSNFSGHDLRFLNARNTSICSLEPLRGMNLSSLDISSTDVEDLRPLEGMPLRQFFASYTKIIDISPLCKSPLEDLYLSGTIVQDIKILSTLNLKTLYIVNTPLEASDLDYFKKSSPNTVVYNDVSDLKPLSTNAPQNILLAEDVPTSLNLYSIYLSRLGYNVTQASTGMELMKKALTQSFDIIISDVVMPSGYGDDIVEILREKGNVTPVILITGMSHSKKAQSLGAVLLQKPFELEQLGAAITEILNSEELALQELS